MKSNQWGCIVVGDRDAFLAVYESHYQALFAYGFSLTANRELTKDSIQEMFLEIWQTRTTLNKEVEHVRSYLFTWLRRKISSELGRSNTEKQHAASMDILSSDVLSYEDLLIAFQQSEEDKHKLHSALKKLSKGQLEVIRLKFFENLSYPEIAIRTGLSPRTVYNLVYEAMCHLRESMRILPLLSLISLL